MADERPTLRETDEGKTVVDAAGEEIGMVTDVTADGMYVQPDPSLIDRVKATLDWSDRAENEYRIDTGQIERIDGTQIEIRDTDESGRGMDENE